jgi:hypothetical protein
MGKDKSDQRKQEALATLNDLAAEVGQSAIEVITSADIFEHLPFVKDLIAAANLVASIRDMLLMRKIETFLRRLAYIPQEDRIDMIRRLEDDPSYTESVGEHLVELLDRLEGQRKAAMAGRCVRGLRAEGNRPQDAAPPLKCNRSPPRDGS